MTERKPNKPTPIDIWKSIVERLSETPSPWNSHTDDKGGMCHWVFETLKELKSSRGIDIELDRIYYFFKKLQTMDYTPEIAEDAQLWMEIGDWTHKGSNPTVELSDFFPTEEQIESVRKRMNREITESRAAMSQWISVTERLPNEEESIDKVIVIIGNDIFSATFIHEENFFVAISPNGSGYRIEHTKQDGVDRYVTAWMPMPDLYVNNEVMQ
jgi:hypothetical protein